MGRLFLERTRREPQRALAAAIGFEDPAKHNLEHARAAAPTEAELGYALDVALKQVDTNERRVRG